MKPGDRVFYGSPEGPGITGIILDRAPGANHWWVHRKDGNFDVIVARADDNPCDIQWVMRRTPSGQCVPVVIKVAA